MGTSPCKSTVAAISHMKKTGMSVAETAKKFKISRGTIYRSQLYLTWRAEMAAAENN